MAFSTVSVVGSGPIGCGIALACAAEQMPVTLIRAARSELEAIRARLTRRLAIAVEASELTTAAAAEVLARIEIVSDLGRAADGDLVVDTTICDPRARRAMLATLESKLSGGAVLATTASSDRLAEIAEALRRPDQLVGMRLQHATSLISSPTAHPNSPTAHPNSPTAHPNSPTLSVELTVLPETAPGVIAAARAFCAMLHKTSLETASQPPRVGYREWLSLPATTRPSPSALSAPSAIAVPGGTRRAISDAAE